MGRQGFENLFLFILSPFWCQSDGYENICSLCFQCKADMHVFFTVETFRKYSVWILRILQHMHKCILHKSMVGFKGYDPLKPKYKYNNGHTSQTNYGVLRTASVYETISNHSTCGYSVKKRQISIRYQLCWLNLISVLNYHKPKVVLNLTVVFNCNATNFIVYVYFPIACTHREENNTVVVYCGTIVCKHSRHGMHHLISIQNGVSRVL